MGLGKPSNSTKPSRSTSCNSKNQILKLGRSRKSIAAHVGGGGFEGNYLEFEIRNS